MKRSRGRMATTTVDLHGEAFHPDVIKDAAQKLQTVALPILDEHDWRRYVGRSVGGELERMEGGHLALVRDMEVFERGDTVPPFDNKCRLRPLEQELDRPSVQIDPNHLFGDDLRLMKEFQQLTQATKINFRNKAVTGVEYLVAGAICFGIFALTSSAGGFFSSFGQDLYTSAKKLITGWASDPQNSAKILQVRVLVQSGGDYEVRVYIHASVLSTSAANFDDVWANVRKSLLGLQVDTSSLQHVIYEFDDSGLHLLQLVRKDGVPLIMDNVPTIDLKAKGLSASGGWVDSDS